MKNIVVSSHSSPELLILGMSARVYKGILEDTGEYKLEGETSRGG